MADKMPTETIPAIEGEASALASANAPFIYFDAAQNFGTTGGVAFVTLEAGRCMSVEGNIRWDRVVVAHLRMGPAGLASLKEAIAKIELMTAPTETGTAN